MTADPLLRVQDLRISIKDGDRTLYPLQGISFDIAQGELFGLVGESGSGKSLTAAAILGLLPSTARVHGGSIEFDGQELADASEEGWRAIRGREIAIVFQNPRASINPVLTVGSQIAELLRRHQGLAKNNSWSRAVELLGQMGIADPAGRARDYVHQYSGGMAQRASLAMAMACAPRLLIADEPTSGLDVTLQEQVLELLVDQVRGQGSSLMLITHDIGIVSSTCDSVAVLYAGITMEQGSAGLVLEDPTNPYTRLLLEAYEETSGSRMKAIPGHVPQPLRPHTGCPFGPRCDQYVPDHCDATVPSLESKNGRLVACHRV